MAGRWDAPVVVAGQFLRLADRGLHVRREEARIAEDVQPDAVLVQQVASRVQRRNQSAGRGAGECARHTHTHPCWQISRSLVSARVMRASTSSGVRLKFSMANA